MKNKTTAIRVSLFAGIVGGAAAAYRLAAAGRLPGSMSGVLLSLAVGVLAAAGAAGFRLDELKRAFPAAVAAPLLAAVVWILISHFLPLSGRAIAVGGGIVVVAAAFLAARQR